MNLLPAPGLPPAPAPEPSKWRWLLYGSAAAVAIASCRPWICVRFTRLFGDHLGPPAWQGTAGFTCLTTAMLVAVLALAETGSARTQVAVRPASLLLVTIAALLLLGEAFAGPGTLRGVSAMWTGAFYAAAVAVLLLLAACGMRQRHSGRQPATAD
ncbi:MAG: hypothetical protein JNN13_09260 [Planctomycetes bacterium]|nr:hypothetical protein [Planctomycetota bacterium]